MTLRYARDARQAVLSVRPAGPLQPNTMRTLIEIYAVAGCTNLPPELLDPLRPVHVHLPFAEPAHAGRYRALRGVRVHFGKSGLPELRLVYPVGMVTAELADGNAAAHAGPTEQLDRLQRQIGRSTRVWEWTRLLLAEAEAFQPTAEEIAGLLNVSRRTFERALAAEGVHYRELSQQVRLERARTLLRDSKLPIAQIAYQLGYGDQAAFSHEFRGLVGLSPSAYRQVSCAGA